MTAEWVLLGILIGLLMGALLMYYAPTILVWCVVGFVRLLKWEMNRDFEQQQKKRNPPDAAA